MGAPNWVSARSTISMARSTPAQKPRGWANRISLSLISSSQRGNKFDFEFQRLAGQRMVEVEQTGFIAQLAQDAGEAAAARSGEVDQVAHFVVGARHRVVVQRGAGDFAHQFRVARAEA